MFSSNKKLLAFTFGNHMHWVDMEWLWGYDVLPGSVRDMLRICDETGAKGCVNFDAVGYEKMASECPEELELLRQAVRAGRIEIVGASYAQPYGLFHGPESNIRQRIYGLRTCMRLFGVQPTTFWEEEFDFFPQLPQILKKCGFDAASLFFQWTWHTPEIPKEDLPAIRWRGCDGSEIVAATRNAYNLHQWPEDFETLLSSLAQAEPNPKTVPLIQQWVELMPSPDWMCRSEVLLPVMQRFLNDPQFEISKVTLGEYLRSVDADSLPVREYSMDNVWHGMTLGKYGDRIRAISRSHEEFLLKREAIASVYGLFGRPYPRWDVYSTWEFDESWRNLFIGQHHDNCECEGLCGDIGLAFYDRATSFDLRSRVVESYADRVTGSSADIVLFNPLGWHIRDPMYGGIEIPPYGHVSVPRTAMTPKTPNLVVTESWSWTTDNNRIIVTSDNLSNSDTPEAQIPHKPMVMIGDRPLAFDFSEGTPSAISNPEFRSKMELSFSITDSRTDIHFTTNIQANTIQPGYGGAVRLCWDLPFENTEFIVDTPYDISPTLPKMEGCRKYPSGDWMTSEQWFEMITGGLFSSSFLDLVDPVNGNGILICHHSCMQWFVRGGRLEAIVLAADPWDADRSYDDLWCKKDFVVIPHGEIKNIDRYRLARQAYSEPLRIPKQLEGGDIAKTFSALQLDSHGSAVTAFYRELTSFAGRNLKNYAGEGIEHPYILRIVEFNGEPDNVVLRVRGPVARAFRTNLLGEIECPIRFQFGSDGYSTAEFELAPKEIVTIYADLAEGRKQVRDLDAKREIWATIHRQNT